MTKVEIVERMAKNRVVERFVCNTARAPLSPDLKDLCQMVYLIILEYDEEKVVDLWETGAMQFFVARIIINQFRSSKSRYHYLIRRFQSRTDDITDKDFADE